MGSVHLESNRVDGERRAHLPGDVGMWVFVLGDLLIFSAYFVIFMIHRSQDRDFFLAQQQHLDQALAVVNTLVLLLSSRLVAHAVQAARAGDHPAARRFISYGGLCGGLFVLIKIHEWMSEIGHGHTIASNDFFMFYFMLTGIHLFHVVLGLIVLGVVLNELREPGEPRVTVVESGAIYWHMVDLLWIIIFALVYLLR